jgi:hypothetical protein
MRKLVTLNLMIALLTPWLAVTGVGEPIVACPMHRTGLGDPGQARHGIAASHHQRAEHNGTSHHDSTAHGCSCAGECGRSGTSFSLWMAQTPPVAAIPAYEANFQSKLPRLVSADLLLPFPTGPPQRLGS